MRRTNAKGVLEHLSRPDKWYLGGGERLIWTPRHPVWWNRPGFWDEAHFDHLAIQPVFAIALIDEHGNEIPLRFEERTWRPDCLVQHYTARGWHVKETKTLTPDDVLVSSLSIQNDAEVSRSLHVVIWTILEHDQGIPHSAEHVDRTSAGWQWRLKQQPDGEPETDIACKLTLAPAASGSSRRSEEAPLQPKWNLTPFCDGFGGALDGARSDPADDFGCLYLGLHVPIEIRANHSDHVRAAFSAAPSRDAGLDRTSSALTFSTSSTPAESAAAHWERVFARAPAFSCSDAHIEMYYRYRWYGLNLFTTREAEGNYKYPAVCEGPACFRKLISYSAPCHMLEARWMSEPSVAQGSLLNFIDNQLPDGRFYGHLFRHFGDDESFYHARWSHVRDVHRIHPDDSFLRRAYEGLSAYAAYFDRERDPEQCGLYDILNHYETGQEYMHRYVAVDENADKIHWGRQFRLKGVDASVYQYEIRILLAFIAQKFGMNDAAAEWQESADRTRKAILTTMWDQDEEMFFDVDSEAGERTRVKAGTCFYPYFSDIVEEQHLAGLKRHLFNPDEFWTPYPAPSSSADDRFFSASPHWKGKRMNCPWNGRVWPMANSHIAEALGYSAARFEDEELRRGTADFIHRFIHMMFFDGDSRRPNCFEHYNPMTGSPSAYRGVDDYQHSWVVDLILRYVCGIRPTENELIVDPFPFGLAHVRVAGVPIRGHRIDVDVEGENVRLTIDEGRTRESNLGNAIKIPLASV